MSKESKCWLDQDGAKRQQVKDREGVGVLKYLRVRDGEEAYNHSR